MLRIGAAIVAVTAALLVLLSGTACGGDGHGQQGQTAVEAAVMEKFQWDKCSIFECSEMHSADDVDCHPTSETLRGTPVYWCLVSYNDNQASTGACVNLASSDLAMAGPVLQTQCDARVAKARVNRFVTEVDDALP
jgi:hypothetical protein